MDGDVVRGRVVGAVAPGWLSDAVSAPVTAPGVSGAGVEGWAGSAVGEGAVSTVVAFREWLAGVDVGSLSDRERVDLVAALERVKGAASAGQARATDALRGSREVVAPRDVARSVGSMVALARRESPSLGDRFVGLSRALVQEMPCTMAALTEGRVSGRVAVAVVTGTSTLSVEDRAEVDRRLAGSLHRLGVRQAGAAATRVAAELDAGSVVARMEAAVRSRRVSVRPAPDGMAYLTVLGPVKDVVGAHASLLTRARGVVGGQCPDEAPEGRGVGAVAADTALRLLSGRGVGELQPVEVHLVMTDRSLLGTGNPDRSVFESARIPGHGPVPAPVARSWLREGLKPPPGGGATGNGDPGGAGGRGVESAGRVWLRRLYTSPDGRDLVAMDSRRRVFTGLLRRMLVLRDDVCTTSWCGAPIVHADHTTPAREGGATSFAQGSGKCARCNHVKEAPGWHAQVAIPDDPDRDDGRSSHDRVERRLVRVTTPLGHRYDSEAPPLLGSGSLTVPPASAVGKTAHEQPTTGDADPVTPSPPMKDVERRGPRPGRRRKRALHRAWAHRGTAPERSRAARRPGLTSHLERELCRYLS